ncbi:hypothetical protein C8Q77DRAFT_1160412 [Trametes polyzona]|nr:hypothetical protein C8Q77DRAFT_1160412 [Trametes polyzona]
MSILSSLINVAAVGQTTLSSQIGDDSITSTTSACPHTSDGMHVEIPSAEVIAAVASPTVTGGHGHGGSSISIGQQRHHTLDTGKSPITTMPPLEESPEEPTAPQSDTEVASLDGSEAEFHGDEMIADLP